MLCCEKIPGDVVTPEDEADILDSDCTAGCAARSVTARAAASRGLVAGCPATTGLTGAAALAACAAHDD